MDDSLFFGITVPAFLTLLALSALFSGSETALTSMTKLRVKRLFSDGDPAYKKLESWLEDPNRYLVTILVGNNIVNVGVSILASAIFTRLLGRLGWEHNQAVGGGIAFGVVTFLLLVFGEITPKTYAKQHAVRISQLVISPLDVFYRLFSPFILAFLVLSNLTIRLLGGERVDEVPMVTAEDVRTLIEVSEKEGLLDEEEREMIHHIMDFGDTIVRETMTPRVDMQAFDVNTPFDEVRRAVVEGGHSRIPVYEGDIDSIIGVLYAKDLLASWDNVGEEWSVRDTLRPALFIPKNKKVNDLLQTFRKERTHLAIVVDEYGCTAGIVTIEDILEEIVGDIQDEHDQEPPEYQVSKDGTITANAKLDVDILREKFGIDLALPEAEFESLGGFITTYLGDLPSVGDLVEYDNIEMTILDADDRRIKRVRIVRKEPQEEEEEERSEDDKT